MAPILRPWVAAKPMSSGRRGHGAVVVHDLADHRGGFEPGDAGQVAAGFGVAGADQHAARLLRHHREDVAGLTMSAALAWRHGGLHGARAVGGGDAGGDALGGLDRHREGGRELAVRAPSG